MTEQKIQSHKDLKVWQKSMDLIVLVYKLSEKYPKSELYGLTSQTRRSAVSIPSNIAEGYRRKTRKDYCNFLTIAFGSGSELETQLEIASRLNFVDKDMYDQTYALLQEVMPMLNSLIQKLRS